MKLFLILYLGFGGISLTEIGIEVREQSSFTENKEKIHTLNVRSKELATNSPKESLSLAKEAYELSMELGYKQGIAESLLMIGYASRGLSSYSESMPGLQEALDIYVSLGNLEGQMRVLTLLGVSYFYLARYEQALENFKNALGLAIRLQNKNIETSIINNIGEIYREMGKPEEALDYYFNALKTSEECGLKHNMSVVSMNIGHIHNNASEYQKALEYYNKSLRISCEIKDDISRGEVLTKIGEVHEKQIKTEEALEFYKESLSILEACENVFYKIDALINLGSFYVKQKEFNLGIDYLNTALDYAHNLNADRKSYGAHLLLAESYEACGDFVKALYHHKRYHDIERRVITDNLEEKLKIITVEYKLDKLHKESEIYRLRNIELKQKNEEIESKIMQLAVTNDKLSDEISKRIELQVNLEQANKKLEHLSYIDELTGIPNRRIFNEVIRKQWNRCMQESIPLSVILLDIDYFKNYNDNYGHLQGDECLKKVAKTLAGSIKHSYDFIGRFGGEEFGIILPGTGYEFSIMIAEQMRISVESLRVSQEYTTVSPYITISLGVATVMPGKHMHYHELIDSSDKQLYKAKQEGRNRVCAIKL